MELPDKGRDYSVGAVVVKQRPLGVLLRVNRPLASDKAPVATRYGEDVAIDYDMAPVKDRNGLVGGTVLAFHRIDETHLEQGIREEARAWPLISRTFQPKAAQSQ